MYLYTCAALLSSSTHKIYLQSTRISLFSSTCAALSTVFECSWSVHFKPAARLFFNCIYLYLYFTSSSLLLLLLYFSSINGTGTIFTDTCKHTHTPRNILNCNVHFRSYCCIQMKLKQQQKKHAKLTRNEKVVGQNIILLHTNIQAGKQSAETTSIK